MLVDFIDVPLSFSLRFHTFLPLNNDINGFRTEIFQWCQIDVLRIFDFIDTHAIHTGWPLHPD